MFLLADAVEGATGLEQVTVVVEQMFTYMGNLVTTISSKPLLLIPVGIFVGGAAIGLAKRLIGA